MKQVVIPLIPLLLLTMPEGISAQDSRPRASIVVISSEGDDPTLGTLASTIATTLELSFRLIGEFAMEPSVVRSGQTAVDLETIAGELGAEFLFSVRIGRSEAGSYILDAEVFSTPDGEVTSVIQESAGSLFDVFDAADRVTLSLIEEVTAVEVAFGSLSLVNDGFPGPYEVQIDGVSAGSSLSGIERVLAGRRTVSILRQGEAEAIYRDEVLVPDGGNALVRFNLPYLPSEAEARLSRYHRASLSAFLGEPGAAVNAEAVRAAVPADRGDSVEELIALVEESSEVPGHETLPIEVISQFRQRANRALARSQVPSRPFLPALKDGWVFADSAPVQRSIEIDGDPGDWQGIAPIRRDTDAVGDGIDDRFGAVVERSEPGTDFAELRLAEGEDGLYLLITFYDGAPSGSDTSYEIAFEAVKQGQSDPWDRIGLIWSSDGGEGNTARVRLIDLGGSDRQITAQIVPRRISGDGIESVIPHRLINMSRSHAGMNGWDIRAVAEISTAEETLGTDEIRYGTKVHF